jgi:hypothetical protein
LQGLARQSYQLTFKIPVCRFEFASSERTGEEEHTTVFLRIASSACNSSLEKDDTQQTDSGMVYIQPSHLPLTIFHSRLRYRHSIPSSSEAASLFYYLNTPRVGNKPLTLWNQTTPSPSSAIEPMPNHRDPQIHSGVRQGYQPKYIPFSNGTFTISQENFCIQLHAILKRQSETIMNYQGGAITT